MLVVDDDRTVREVHRVGDGEQARSCSTHRRVSRDGHEIALTGREFDQLRFLLANPGVAYSAVDLLPQVWLGRWVTTRP